MKVRLKFNIQHMTKSHRSGDVSQNLANSGIAGREKGANLLRSLVVMFATRPPDKNGETLGLYLNKMNTGVAPSSYYSVLGATYNHSAGTSTDQKTITFSGDQGDDIVADVTVSGNGITPGTTVVSVSAGSNTILLSAVVTTTVDNGKIFVAKHVDFNATNDSSDAQRMNGGFDADSHYINIDNYSEITRNNLDGEGIERVNNYNAMAIMNFSRGNMWGGGIEAEQSNADNEDGRMYMFHSGDDNTRRNYWDGYYEVGDYRDVGVTDFLPIILKADNNSASAHQRVGDTFTGAAHYNDVGSHQFSSLRDTGSQVGVIKNR